MHSQYHLHVTCYLVLSLLENYAKMNRNRFPIAVLLTTMICNRQTTYYNFILFFHFASRIYKYFDRDM